METPEEEYKRGLNLFSKKKFTEAFQAWRSSADRGFAKAMCDVGWMYSQRDKGVDMDEDKAFEYMLKAAQLGYVRAQNNIGLYYKNGTGTIVDIPKAVYWLELAEKGKYEKLAENTLKNCRAMLARQPNEHLTPEQEHALGMTAFTNKDYKVAFDKWLSAARNGSAEAMCDVGWMFSQGHGVAKNNSQAFKWMCESAKLNYVRAQNNIGLYYKNGTGCNVDLEQAVEWLEKAEKANYPKLAKKTLQEAREMLAKNRGMPLPNAAINATPHHAYALGLEMFGKRKYKQAFEYWLDAANKGYSKAMCDVGWMFSQGHGVQRNNQKAFEWMLQAAQSGYHRAQNNIGLYYKNGTGCKVDMKLAVEWLERAEAANYDKLARKALKEAKRILEQEELTAAAGITFTPMPPMGAAASSKSDGLAGGPESSMEKYKSALRMGLATGSLSQEEIKVLADLRREHDITDELHKQCLMDLGYTLEEYDKMKSGDDEQPIGSKNECVVCLDAVADHCILFCMHVCLCEDCSKNYMDENGKGKGVCPKCRSNVEMVKKIF